MTSCRTETETVVAAIS